MARDVSVLIKVKDGFSTGLKRASAGFKKMSASIFKSANIYKAAFAAVVATVGSSLKVFDAFNTSMGRVEGLLGGVKADGLRKEIKALSSEFGIARDELVDGLYNALSAGVPKDNAISFLRTASKAAVVDGSSVSVAVDGMTSVINAFGASTNDAGAIASAMFQAVKTGKTTFSELSASISNVAPIASAMGVSFEEVFAAVATLTKTGTPTSKAMTQIAAALQSTNEELGDGWSQTMSLQQAFVEMGKRSDGSANQLKSLAGRIEAVQGILGLTGANALTAANDLNTLSESAGSLETSYENLGDRMGRWQKLSNAISNNLETLGEKFTNFLAPAIDATTKFFDKLDTGGFKANKRLQSVIKAISKLGSIGIGARLLLKTNAFGDEEENKPKEETDHTEAVEAELQRIKNLSQKQAELRRQSAQKEKEVNDEKAAAQAEANKAMLIAERELNAAIQSARDAEVNAYLAAQDEKTKIAKEAAQARKQAELEAAKETAEKQNEILNRKADNKLFKNLTPTFAERFKDFVNRRDERQSNEEETRKIKERMDKIREKEERGTKLNKSDQKFKDDVNQFRKAEAEAKQLREKGNNLLKSIEQKLADNLAASGGPA